MMQATICSCTNYAKYRRVIMIPKNIQKAVTLLSLLIISACGGGGGGTVVTAPVSGQTAVQSSATGVTASTATVALETATVSVPAGTALKAEDGTPVTGNVEIAATYGTLATFLPVAEQTTLPTTSTVKAYVSINISGDKKVKTVNPPIPVVVNVALPNGSPVDIYSNNETTGATWVKEGSTVVVAGKVAFNVSHFSTYAVMQQNLTGATGGSN
jgi:hypothetical protein